MKALECGLETNRVIALEVSSLSLFLFKLFFLFNYYSSTPSGYSTQRTTYYRGGVLKYLIQKTNSAILWYNLFSIVDKRLQVMPVCKQCETEKEQSEFGFYKHTGKHDKTCKKCRVRNNKKYLKDRMANDEDFKNRYLESTRKGSLKNNRSGAARVKKLNKLNAEYFSGEKITQEELDKIIQEQDKCYCCGKTQDEFKEFKERLLSYDGNDSIAKFLRSSVYKTSKQKSADEFVFAQKDSSKPNVYDNLARACYHCKMTSSTGIGLDFKKDFVKKLVDYLDDVV